MSQQFIQDCLLSCLSRLENQMGKVENKVIVLLLGNTWAGKSTLLNCIAEASLKGDIERDKPFIRCESGEVAKIADPISIVDSVTDFPNFWSTEDAIYCDCPGFADTRGFEKDILNAFLIQSVMKTAKNGIKIVLVVEESKCDGNCSDFLSILTSFSTLFPDFHENMRGVAIVLSKVPYGNSDKYVDSARKWFGQVASNSTLSDHDKCFLNEISKGKVPLIAFQKPDLNTLHLSEDDRNAILDCIKKLDNILSFKSHISISPASIVKVQGIIDDLYIEIGSKVDMVATNNCEQILETTTDFESLKKMLCSLEKEDKNECTRTFYNDLIKGACHSILNDDIFDLLEVLDFCVRIKQSTTLENNIQRWKETIEKNH